jgi:uncharacterized membrane protein
MNKERMEAFSDAILAIIMTIQVLELTAPATADWSALWNMGEKFAVYAMSFYLLAIYWVNHHHLLQLAGHVRSTVLWSNMLMLFLMSLVPFVTSWAGNHLYDFAPCMCYGILFLLINLSYALLSYSLARAHHEQTLFCHVRAHHDDRKLPITLILNVLILPLAFIEPWLVLAGCIAVASIWFVPSRKAEECLEEARRKSGS